MPLSSYTLIHKNVQLTAVQKLKITKWAASLKDTIKANNPPESVSIKRSPPKN